MSITTTRRIVQFGFLILTLVGVFVVRGNAERWCPFGGVEALYEYVREGNMLCSLGVSNFYILGGVLLATLLLRRVFCGYICPIGTISEWLYGPMGTSRREIRGQRVLWCLLLGGLLGAVLVAPLGDGQGGLSGMAQRGALGMVLGGLLVVVLFELLPWVVARLGLRVTKVPYRLDRGLALLKYGVVAIILYITYQAGELLFREFGPCYALLSRHGEDITIWAYIVSGAIVVGSLMVIMPFCRWLCPLAAVLNPFSRFGLTRIRRSEEFCRDCTECAKVCPMAIPVDQVREVKSARCISCLQCVEACPERAAGALVWGPPKSLGRGWPHAVLIAIMLACVSAAVAATYVFPMPSFVKIRGEVGAETATLALRVEDLACRGRANLFTYFLERDDMYEVSGYLKIEAWPGPGAVDVRITYDPNLANPGDIKRAISEPYYDLIQNVWRISTFDIEGYDPLGLDEALPGP
ncbi:MAG: 4Fe-4S binding protein [Phycisphaerae bacterium]|nr:4Fe-4S binding protein [Phycisphaerae bacterium]